VRGSPGALRWRRTRAGLLLTSIGLIVLWLPLVAALGALFLSFGSTFFFLGGRAAGRKHEVSVAIAFLLLTVGGVITGIFLLAFLLETSSASSQDYPLASLREPARRLLWDTIPGTMALAAGIALQVHRLVPDGQRRRLYLFCAAVVVTAVAATWLAEPELALLDERPVTPGLVLDFLVRISAYRLLEAPAYLGLAAIHLRTYANDDVHVPTLSAVSADPPV
jgi:hypothetical protein